MKNNYNLNVARYVGEREDQYGLLNHKQFTSLSRVVLVVHSAGYETLCFLRNLQFIAMLPAARYWPRPEPDESSVHSRNCVPKIHLILSSHLFLVFPSGLFTSDLATKFYTFLICPIPTACFVLSSMIWYLNSSQLRVQVIELLAV